MKNISPPIVFVFIIGILLAGLFIFFNFPSQKTDPEICDLALTSSDLPAGFIDYGECPKSILNRLQRRLAGETAKSIKYYKTSCQTNKSTTIEQVIIISRGKETDSLFAEMSSFHQKIAPLCQKLPDPLIGESSHAYRATDIKNRSFYIILFKQENIIENIQLSGDEADYALLTSIAQKAEQKIS